MRAPSDAGNPDVTPLAIVAGTKVGFSHAQAKEILDPARIDLLQLIDRAWTQYETIMRTRELPPAYQRRIDEERALARLMADEGFDVEHAGDGADAANDADRLPGQPNLRIAQATGRGITDDDLSFGAIALSMLEYAPSMRQTVMTLGEEGTAADDAGSGDDDDDLEEWSRCCRLRDGHGDVLQVLMRIGADGRLVTRIESTSPRVRVHAVTLRWEPRRDRSSDAATDGGNGSPVPADASATAKPVTVTLDRVAVGLGRPWRTVVDVPAQVAGRLPVGVTIRRV